MRTDDDHSPISAQNAKRLFADWKAAPAIVLAVSGGPDSIALMWLAARWRSTLARGPRLIAVTVDHGLRAEAAAERIHEARAAFFPDVNLAAFIGDTSFLAEFVQGMFFSQLNANAREQFRRFPR